MRREITLLPPALFPTEDSVTCFDTSHRSRENARVDLKRCFLNVFSLDSTPLVRGAVVRSRCSDDNARGGWKQDRIIHIQEGDAHNWYRSLEGPVMGLLISGGVPITGTGL